MSTNLRQDLALTAYAVTKGFTIATYKEGDGAFNVRGIPPDSLRFHRPGFMVWETARGWRVAGITEDGRLTSQPTPDQFFNDLKDALDDAIRQSA